MVFSTLLSTNPNSPVPTEMKDALLHLPRPTTPLSEYHSFCKADVSFCSSCLPALKAKINCTLNLFPSNAGTLLKSIGLI